MKNQIVFCGPDYNQPKLEPPMDKLYIQDDGGTKMGTTKPKVVLEMRSPQERPLSNGKELYHADWTTLEEVVRLKADPFAIQENKICHGCGEDAATWMISDSSWENSGVALCANCLLKMAKCLI